MKGIQHFFRRYAIFIQLQSFPVREAAFHWTRAEGLADDQQGFKFSRRRIKNYENPRVRRDVYTCRPGSQEFSATRVGGAGGGGGGQIKLRREIYGRTCNEQLFHGMRTPGLASGGGISIRSSSCRPRARGPRPLLRVALFSSSLFPPESFIPRKKKDSSHILPQPPSLPSTRKDVLLMKCIVITLPSRAHIFVLRHSALKSLS